MGVGRMHFDQKESITYLCAHSVSPPPFPQKRKKRKGKPKQILSWGVDRAAKAATPGLASCLSKLDISIYFLTYHRLQVLHLTVLHSAAAVVRR